MSFLGNGDGDGDGDGDGEGEDLIDDDDMKGEEENGRGCSERKELVVEKGIIER